MCQCCKNLYEEVLDSLERAYPGQLYLSVNEFAKAKGQAVGTVYNDISKKNTDEFGIKVVRIGNKPKFRIHDVARYLSKL